MKAKNKKAFGEGEIGEEFSIKPQNSSLGIYIEEIANLRIYNREWILVTKIDFDFYSNEFAKIVELHERLEASCDFIINNTRVLYKNLTDPYCKAPLQQIKNMIDESRHLSSDWFVRRKKRSLASVLGGVILGGIGFNLLSTFQSNNYNEQFEEMRAQNKLRTQ